MTENYSCNLVNTHELAQMIKRTENLGMRFLIQKLNKDFDKNCSMLRVYKQPALEHDSPMKGQTNKDLQDELRPPPKMMFKITSNINTNF